ncbi:type II secretion system protein [Sulfurimonas autotrophica]|uniref:Fimbrial protein n=1 Tax=Sulfurimonas autotrophica (strain ATCC BAA-671 / DSM 16294 / JCM 11897 / OK10) TaxID=563040 RepID=E0UUY0_SULAO|nr:type II secretion system protein [Sulfurimonas autotrophica]ADN08492.1 fimbrial protein [Sulfurimonas autotrophica DSM 16294]
MKKAFTLIELIFVLVIIGVLAAVAIPKFGGLIANSKVSAELATASTIQSALDDVHSDWIISEGSFSWGNDKNESDINSQGYPKKLGNCPPAFDWILKSSSIVNAKWTCVDNGDGTFKYEGPASQADSGVNSIKEGKPDKSKHWDYNSSDGSFSLVSDS